MGTTLAEPQTTDTPALQPRFVQVRSGSLNFKVNEAYLQNLTLQTMLDSPEEILSLTKGVLKHDHRSKLVRTEGLVLKRFQRRSFSHGIRGMIQMSDAERTWDRAWRLLAAGIPTAEPVAYADKRVLGFWLSGYLVVRAIPKGVSLRSYLRKHGPPPPELVRELAQILARFHNAGFHWNRDLNDKNILIGKGDRIYLIDVDGVRFERRDTVKRQLRDLEILRAALSKYPQLSAGHRTCFMRTYFRLRRDQFKR